MIPPGEVHTGETLSEVRWVWRAFYPSQSAIDRLWAHLGSDTAAPTLAVDQLPGPCRLPGLRGLGPPAGFPSGVRGRRAAARRVVAGPRARLRLPAPGRWRRSVAGERSPGDRGGTTRARLPRRPPGGQRHAVGSRRGGGRRHVPAAARLPQDLRAPPHRFQLGLRIIRAKELIGRGASLSQAALDPGFCDQSHFSRHFKRIVGVTPQAYARALGAAAGKELRGSS